MTLEDRFEENVADARENGYDLVCVHCGCAMDESTLEDDESHEPDCPNRGRDRVEEMMQLLRKRGLA